MNGNGVVPSAFLWRVFMFPDTFVCDSLYCSGSGFFTFQKNVGQVDGRL